MSPDIPRPVGHMRPVSTHSPAQDTLQISGTAGEPATQLLQKFLFTQTVNNWRNALRQTEESKNDNGGQLLGLPLNKLPLVENWKHEVHKVGEQVDSELGTVKGDRSASCPISAIEDPEPPSLHEYPHVAVENDQRAQPYKEHLL